MIAEQGLLTAGPFFLCQDQLHLHTLLFTMFSCLLTLDPKQDPVFPAGSKIWHESWVNFIASCCDDHPVTIYHRENHSLLKKNAEPRLPYLSVVMYRWSAQVLDHFSQCLLPGYSSAFHELWYSNMFEESTNDIPTPAMLRKSASSCAGPTIPFGGCCYNF